MELSRRALLTSSLAAGGIAALGMLTPERARAAVLHQGSAVRPRLATTLLPLSWDVRLPPIGARGSGTTVASWDAVNQRCLFTYTEGAHTVAYLVDVASAALQDGLIAVSVQVDGGTSIPLVSGAGTYYLPASGAELTPDGLASAGSATVTPGFASGVLTLDYVEVVGGVQSQKTYAFQLTGSSLQVRITSPSVKGRSGYSGVSTGRLATASSLAQHTVVFVEEVAVSLVGGTTFVSSYLDKARCGGTRVSNTPSVSSGVATHGMRSHYELNSDGETNPLDETLYVTASPHILDCVYLTNASASAHRGSLDERIIYDTWEYRPSYQERKRHYRYLRQEFGMEDLFLIDHRWQRDTLDISNPAFYPASTVWGSAPSFADYLATTAGLGWAVVLHEDYWFMYPSATNQYWNVPGVVDKLAQDASGAPRLGWLDTSYANKSDEMAGYAEIESQLIHDNYGTSAAFLDVNGGVDPSVMNQVTLNGASATSRSLAQVVADNVVLFETMKDIYDGPIMSEGAQGDRAFGSAYAGHVDATEREITGLHGGRIAPDYELVHIRPLQANQGMGYPARFDPDAVRFRHELSGASTGTGVANLPKLSTGAVGDHGLYYFAATGTGAGTTLTPMTRGSDATLGGEYWYHDDGGGSRSFVAPLRYAGIGVAQPGTVSYPVVGFRVPESGWFVARFSATAYPQPGSGGFTIRFTHNGFDAGSEITGDALDEHWVKVIQGDMIYLSFVPNGTRAPGDHCGYYGWVAFADIESPARLVPVVSDNYEICGSGASSASLNLAQDSTGLQDDFGLQYFAATGSGASTRLTQMRLAFDGDLGGEYWADTDGPSAAHVAPLMHSAIGVATADGTRYPVVAIRAPKGGTVYLGFSATPYVSTGSAGFTVEVYQNGFAASNRMTATASGQFWICVEPDDVIYLSFRPNGALVAGDHVGYYAYFSYSELRTARRRGTTHTHVAASGATVNCQNALPAPLPQGLALSIRPGFDFDFDRYNAMAIAYGHTGFIGEVHHGMYEEQVNAYFSFRALQPQYLDTSVSPTAIEYYGAGSTAMSLSTAIKGGYDFSHAKLRISYSNGLTIHLNFSSSVWTVSSGGTSYDLDANGYVAVNSSIGFRQYSCLRSGHRVDFVDCAEYTYANPRGVTTDFGGGLVTSGLVVTHK